MWYSGPGLRPGIAGGRWVAVVKPGPRVCTRTHPEAAVCALVMRRVWLVSSTVLEIVGISLFASGTAKIVKNHQKIAGRLRGDRSPGSRGVRRTARVFRIADGGLRAKMKTKIRNFDFCYAQG